MKNYNTLYSKIIPVITILFIYISLTNNLLSQEFRGVEAQKIVKNADYVIKDSKLYLPTFIRFAKGYEIEYTNWLDWLNQNFKISNDLNFILIGTEKDNLNEIHYRYQQTFKGIPIYGSIYIVHTKNNKVISLNGKILDKFDSDNNISLNENQALSFALNYVNAIKYKWEIPEEEKLIKQYKNNENATYYPKGELTYIPENGNLNSQKFVLSYKFDIYADKPLSKQDIYVDVFTGKIVMTRNKLFTTDVTGTVHTTYSGVRTMTADSYGGSYRLRETGRGNGIETYNCQATTTYSNTDFTDTDNDWNNVNAQQDEVATDAHWGTEMTYDYFFYKHNRNSIDNAGFKLISYVHYDVSYVNAFWDGTRMTYGDGDATYSPLTTLDICGHEITHGLTTNTANLDYQNESGALNEGFSDIFGTCIEWYAKPPLTPNWAIGEDIGAAFRNMSNPNNFSQPDTYLDEYWYTGTGDNGGVHTNSGVLNYWFYLIAHGGSGTNYNGDSYSVTGITIDTAATIAFRALTVYLTNTSVYADARTFTIQATVDLYGSCSPEVEAVTDAWYAVGIGAQYSASVASDFSACPVSFSTTPAYTTFTNSTTNGVSYIWYFGDGATSTLANPSHSYSTTGNFTVKLVAYGGACGNDSITKISFINVGASYSGPTTMPATGTGTTKTTCTGTLFDSGGCSDYANNTSGTITIAPTGATSVVLNFVSFSFELNYDYLYVYDGPSTSSTLIGQYTGDTLPNGGTITSTGSSITLKQTSDQYSVKSGFELNWICSSPNNPPTANFVADNTTSCTGAIQFTDMSLNVPTSWSWDFGDGGISNLQNPYHTYTASGTYTVSLISTNINGVDTLAKTSYITISLPANPTTNSATICGSGSTTLTATGSGKLNWYNSQTGGTAINTGTTYTTPVLTSSETYYVESEIVSSPIYGGKLTNTGGGGYLSASQYLIFDCYTPVTLVSVNVYAQSTGNRTIELRNSAGTVLKTATVNIPIIGLNTVTLNFAIPIGTNMQLGLSSSSVTDLYRNNVASGVTYPYTTSGLISITTSSAGAGYYYWFYNWKLQGASCYSSRSAITANVTQGTPADISISSDQADTICYGTNVTYTAVPVNGGSSPSYDWIVNGSLITSNTTGVFSTNIISSNDVVSCVLTSNALCALNNPDTSNSIQFTVVQAPSPGYITISADSVCFGGSSVITINGNSGTIQWQDSTIGSSWANIPGANSSSYTTPALNSSTYYRAYLSMTNCTNISSVSLINVGPIGGNAYASDDTLCSGDTLILSVSNYLGHIQWQESSNGNTWTNIIAANIPVYSDYHFNSPGYYRALLSQGTCPDSSSDILQVSILQIPVAGFTYTPGSGTISFVNTSTNAASYVWDFGDGTYSTLQNPIHTYSTTGMYNITLKAINDCGENSAIQSINVVITSIQDNLSDNYLQVFPNPNNGIFEIKISSNENKDLQLNIFNIEGRKILSDNIKCINNETSKSIDLSKFEKGIYHLEVISDIRVVNKIIIIQ